MQKNLIPTVTNPKTTPMHHGFLEKAKAFSNKSVRTSVYICVCVCIFFWVNVYIYVYVYLNIGKLHIKLELLKGFN